MQISGVTSPTFINNKQNFKGSSVNSAVFTTFSSYQQIPLETSKSYVSPQITEGYKEIEIFDVPYIGKGKLYELANGHKVILVPKASKTYISTIVGVGFSDEPADKKEMAHLTEHLLGNYWHNAPEYSSINKIFKESGVNANAGTNDNSTSYYMSANVQSNTDLENLIKIQLDTLLNNKFSYEDVQKEKNILIEEGNEKGYFVKEDIDAYDESIKNLFNLDNNDDFIAEHNIQKVKDITKDDITKFYNNFYRPDNMTTIIIGNVDDNSIKTISKHLNSMTNPKTKLQRNNTSNITKDKYIKQSRRTDLESKNKNNLYRYYTKLSFIGPEVTNPKDTENLTILNKILENRLKQNNIEIETEIPTISRDLNVPQLICINSNNFEENNELNIKTIYSVIDDLKKNTASKTELDEAKKQVWSELSDNLENNEKFVCVLSDILLSNSQTSMRSGFGNIKNVSVEDIKNTANKYFDLNKASLVVVRPRGSQTTQSSNVSFSGLNDLENSENIKEYTLPNNLHVIFDIRPGTVKTAISCQFAFENKKNNNDDGFIKIMESSLVKNEDDEFPAGNWIDYKGIHIRKNGSSDDVQIMLNKAKEELIHPEFNKYKITKSKMPQNNELQKDKTIYASDLLEYTNYAKEENVSIPKWLQIDDIKKYYNYLLSNSQGTIIITTPKETLEKIEPEIIKSLSEIPTIKPHDFTKIVNQEETNELEKNMIFLKKSATSDNIDIQKTFKIVHNGNIKDEAGILILNQLLSDKLLKTLRTELGLTYSALSNISNPSPRHSTLTISADLTKAPLDENSKVILENIEAITGSFVASKINEDNLNAIKKQAKADILTPAEMSVDRNLNFESSYEKSYDINRAEKLAKAVDRITPDDLQEIAKKYFTKPYILEISGNKKSLDINKEYLSTMGENISV